jgi:hypothetical protein
MKIAEALGDLFVKIADFLAWTFTHLGIVWGAGALLGILLLSKVVLIFGPMKICWRCKGKSHIGGLLGGRAVCPWCDGKGIRPRIGSRK